VKPAAAFTCQCCSGTAARPRWPGLVSCRGCGVMTMDGGCDPDELRGLYGEHYFTGGEYADYVADKPVIQRTLAGHLDLVRRYVPPGSSLLEVGCAYGYFLELARGSYPAAEGIDVSEDAVAVAVRNGLPARAGDLAAIGFPRPFDAACMWDTIEHVPNPREVFQRVHAALKPGGHFLLTTGDFGSLLARVQGRRWRQIHPPTHVFYFTRRSFRELCAATGFDVVRFGTVPVYRRLGSALRTLRQLHPTTIGGRLAAALGGLLPERLLEWSFPLDLGDTLYLVARKRVTA